MEGLLNPAGAAQADRLAAIERALRTLRLEALPPDARAWQGAPVIHTRSMGTLANRMIQYMAAVSLQARLPGSTIAAIQLPEWGIVTPEPPVREPALRIPTERLDFPWIADRVRERAHGDVVLLQYLQHVGNLLPPGVFRPVFTPRIPPAHVFDDDVLVISLRMEEVLSGYYPLYTLLPAAFYRDVVARTGLRPVFFGQLTPSAYLDTLRAAFPEARFIPGTGAMDDFEVLRHAPNLCLSVSTFAWVAGWLGHARRIVLPVTGLFSPAACASLGGDIDLVPRNDPRFDLWSFPVAYAVPPHELETAHRALEGRFQPTGPGQLADMLERGARSRRRIDAYLACFDPAHYLAAHPEVAAAVADGRLTDAETHYRLHGFDENRTCFPLDPLFYASAWPDAADAVASGRHLDFHHFHVEQGHHRACLPATSPAEPIAA